MEIENYNRKGYFIAFTDGSKYKNRNGIGIYFKNKQPNFFIQHKLEFIY